MNDILYKYNDILFSNITIKIISEPSKNYYDYIISGYKYENFDETMLKRGTKLPTLTKCMTCAQNDYWEIMEKIKKVSLDWEIGYSIL